MKLYEIENIANINYGTRVVKKRDSGTIYDVYGGGGKTFKVDSFNRESCVIVSRFGMSEECVRRVDGKFFLNDSGLSVETKDSNVIIQKYIDWFLFSKMYDIYLLGRGAAQKNLDVDKFRLIKIPVPSLQEQEKIVERLDKVFENIDKKSQYKKEKISYTNDFLKSFHSKIFNYTLSEKSRILELSEVADINSGNSAPQGKEPFVNGKYNFYRTYDVGQIRKGEISESRDKVNEETYSKLKTFPINTILFPKSGASTFNNNRVIIKEEGAIASHLAGIKANPEVLNDYYLYYFLLTVDAKDLIQDSAYPSLNLKQISLIEIPVIPIHEQNELVKQLDVISNTVKRLINLYMEQLLLLSNLKKSILNKEFSHE